jgi:DNA-binding response OmpR family regulator
MRRALTRDSPPAAHHHLRAYAGMARQNLKRPGRAWRRQRSGGKAPTPSSCEVFTEWLRGPGVAVLQVRLGHAGTERDLTVCGWVPRPEWGGEEVCIMPSDVETGKPRVLLVGNNAGLLPSVAHALEEDGFAVLRAHSGHEALARQQMDEPGVVVVDLELGDVDAPALCHQMRTRSAVPIVIVGPRNGQGDAAITACLAQGADAALVEPDSPDLVRAQLHAQLRRARDYGRGQAARSILDLGGLKIDRTAREVLIDGHAVTLTRKEFDLLTTLALNENRVMRCGDLLKEVWGYEECCRTRTLQIHIHRLRTKIEADAHSPQIIVTVCGVGYKLRRPRKATK